MSDPVRELFLAHDRIKQAFLAADKLRILARTTGRVQPEVAHRAIKLWASLDEALRAIPGPEGYAFPPLAGASEALQEEVRGLHASGPPPSVHALAVAVARRVLADLPAPRGGRDSDRVSWWDRRGGVSC